MPMTNHISTFFKVAKLEEITVSVIISVLDCDF